MHCATHQITMYHHNYNVSTLQTYSSCIEFVGLNFKWMLEWHIWSFRLNRKNKKFKSSSRSMKRRIKDVVVIRIKRFSGGCAQFKVEIIIPLNTLELFKDQTSIWANLDIVDWIWKCVIWCNLPFLSNNGTYYCTRILFFIRWYIKILFMIYLIEISMIKVIY
jgi:hypothetical protein